MAMSIQNTGATQQPGQGARADEQFDLDFDVDDLLGQLAYDNPVGAGLGGWNESDASMLAAIAAAEVPPASTGSFAPSLDLPALPTSATHSNPLLAVSPAPVPDTQTELHRRAAAVAIGSSYPVTQAPRAAVAAAPPAVMSSPQSAAAGSGGGASPAASRGRQATATASQSLVPRKATVVTRKRQRVKKAPGASTSSERRRRAKVGQLMETLEKLVCDQEEPDPSAEGNSTVGLLVNQRPQKKRRPTKAEVLRAAVTTIQRLQTVQRPVPRCSAPDAGATGYSIMVDLMHEFRRPDRQEMVAMIYELADSPKFVAGYRNRGLITSVADDGLARRIATFGRIFRLCLPVVLAVVERHGMSPTDTTEVQINCHRDMWQHTHLRTMLGQIRLMWFAPHLKTAPKDKFEPAAMRRALQGIWLAMQSHDFIVQLPSVFANAGSKAEAMDRLAPLIAPLWENAAVELGLPRTMEGIGRFQLAACMAPEADIANLAWYTVGVCEKVCKDVLLPRLHSSNFASTVAPLPPDTIGRNKSFDLDEDRAASGSDDSYRVQALGDDDGDASDL